MKVIYLFFLFSSTSAVIIDCDFTSYTSGDIEIYSCNAAYGSITDDNTTNTIVRGTHLASRTDADVNFFSAIELFMTYFPKDLYKFFPNLISINLLVGYLTSINAADLKFPHLTSITIYQHPITTLDGNLFQHTKKLKEITFAYIHLTNAGRGLLANLDELEMASFIYTDCIDESAWTREEIPRLIDALERQCPPLPEMMTTTLATKTTTESDDGCTDHLETACICKLMKQKQKNSEL